MIARRRRYFADEEMPQIQPIAIEDPSLFKVGFFLGIGFWCASVFMSLMVLAGLLAVSAIFGFGQGFFGLHS